MADSGAPIHAAWGGTVVYADTYAGYGNMLRLIMATGWSARYAHALKVLAKIGDVVMKGKKSERSATRVTPQGRTCL